MDFFDRFCSIMASQEMAANKESDSTWGKLMAVDYTDKEWYI